MNELTSANEKLSIHQRSSTRYVKFNKYIQQMELVIQAL